MKSFFFVCSRDSLDSSIRHNAIGFPDFNNCFLNMVNSAKIGDRIYFYVTKEKVLDAFALIDREYYEDDTPIYGATTELRYRRLGIRFVKTGQQIDFKKMLVPKLSFIKRQDISYSAYLVRNFFLLEPKDAAVMKTVVGK